MDTVSGLEQDKVVFNKIGLNIFLLLLLTNFKFEIAFLTIRTHSFIIITMKK